MDIITHISNGICVRLSGCGQRMLCKFINSTGFYSKAVICIHRKSSK